MRRLLLALIIPLVVPDLASAQTSTTAVGGGFGPAPAVEKTVKSSRKRKKKSAPAPQPDLLNGFVEDKDAEPPIRRDEPPVMSPIPKEAPSPSLLADAERPFLEIRRAVGATVFQIIWVAIIAFLLLRIIAWLIEQRARTEHRLAVTLRRVWPLLEGSIWAAIIMWAIVSLRATESRTAWIFAGVFVVGLLVVCWNAVRDVASGLMLAAERPFDVGDHVRLKEGEGKVVGFFTRVIELETTEGHRMRIPYREVAGATKVRIGGKRTANAVTMHLDLPPSVDPSEALRAARELAASSPWAVLGVLPRVELEDRDAGPSLLLEAYAFDKEVSPQLHAELLQGWPQVLKRLEDKRRS